MERRGSLEALRHAPATWRSRVSGLGHRLGEFFRRRNTNNVPLPLTLVPNQGQPVVESQVNIPEASPDQKLALEKITELGEIGRGIDALPTNLLIGEFTKCLVALKQTAFPEKEKDMELRKELDALVDMSKDPDLPEIDTILLLSKEFLEKLGDDNDLFSSDRQMYRNRAKIRLLIAKIRLFKLHKNNFVETQDDAEVLTEGKAYQYINGSWQEVSGGGYKKEAKPWDFGFLEVDQLPNCKGRKKDSVRIKIGPDQVGWAKESKEVRMDTFRLQHLNTDDEEDINIGIAIDPKVLEYFEHALKVAGFNPENRDKLNPMETIFYRDVLNLLSTGRTKRPINPNISEGIKMYSGSNSGPGDRSFRIYYIDVGHIENVRSLIIVAGCIKSKQDDLFKYIIRK